MFKKSVSLKLNIFLIGIVFLYQQHICASSVFNSSSTLAPTSKTDDIVHIVKKVSHSTVNTYIRKHLPEDLQSDPNNIKRYKKIHSYGVSARVIPITGLLENTGQYAHIGLGQVYGRPVIYIDENYFDHSVVKNHELYEISKWEAKRKELGLKPEEMRRWIIDNFEVAYELAEQWHNEAPSLSSVNHRNRIQLVTEGAHQEERDVNLAIGMGMGLSLTLHIPLHIPRFLSNIELLRDRLFAKGIDRELVKHFIVLIKRNPNPNQVAEKILKKKSLALFKEVSTKMKEKGLEKVTPYVLLSLGLRPKTQAGARHFLKMVEGASFSRLESTLREKELPDDYVGYILSSPLRSSKPEVSLENIVDEDFVMSDRNAALLSEKAKFIHHLADLNVTMKPDVFQYLRERYESVPREGKLNFLRQLNNLLSNGLMSRKDKLATWKLLFEQFIPAFGYFCNKDVWHIFYCLMKDKSLNSEELEPYRLWDLGVESSGEVGISQFVDAMKRLRTNIFLERKIESMEYNNPLVAGIIEQATGFATATWGHGSNRGLALSGFIEEFLDDTPDVGPLEGIEDFEGRFSVSRLGTIDYQKDEISMFRRFKYLIYTAIEILGDEEKETYVEEILKGRLKKIMEDKLKEEKANLEKVSHPRAEEAIKRKIDQIEEVIESMQDATDIIDLIVVLTNTLTEKSLLKDARIQDFIAISLFTEAFRKFPQLKDRMRSLIGEELSLRFINELISLKEDILKVHIFSKRGIKSKSILRFMNIKIFEEAKKRLEVTNESTVVRAFLDKHLLGEMAGDIGDACYTSQRNIMNYRRMLGAILFTQGNSFEESFTGSMLLLENEIDGEKTWIMRAVNPSEEFLGRWSTHDFLNGAIAITKALALEYNRIHPDRPVRYLVVPVDCSGAMSNRPDVNRQISDFVKDDDIILDQAEEFNGYPLKQSCKIVIDLKEESVSSMDSREDGPLDVSL